MCTVFIVVCCYFKQRTAYKMRISDWSSDVCSSDLVDLGSVEQAVAQGVDPRLVGRAMAQVVDEAAYGGIEARPRCVVAMRPQERRVGKECASTCTSRCAPSH